MPILPLQDSRISETADRVLARISPGRDVPSPAEMEKTRAEDRMRRPGQFEEELERRTLRDRGIGVLVDVRA